MTMTKPLRLWRQRHLYADHAKADNHYYKKKGSENEPSDVEVGMSPDHLFVKM